MHRLYQKNELYFALLWVAIYCAVMTPLRGQFGDESPVTVLALVAMAAALSLWTHRHGLTEKYGLGGFPQERSVFHPDVDPRNGESPWRMRLISP